MRAMVFLLCLPVWSFVQAQAPSSVEPPPAAAPPTLDAVLVTGEQPGPGLWKVSKGDHVLWILGTQAPLPKKMAWRSAEVERTIAQSQEVIADAQGKLEIGFFRSIFLLPSILGAKKNADGRKLQDVLPPELYARWLVLKARYVGRDNGMERLRPILAAHELYDKAIDKSGLTNSGPIWKTVEHAAKEHHVRIQRVDVAIPIDDPKQAIDDFKSTTGELETACLATTITRLETDLDAMRTRANAWAVGDIDKLRNLPYPDQRQACIDAVENNPHLRDKLDAAREQIIDAWVAAAEKALTENVSTFAVLAIPELFKTTDGRLSRLRAKGYLVEEPQ